MADLDKKGRIISNNQAVAPHTWFSCVHSDDDGDRTVEDIERELADTMNATIVNISTQQQGYFTLKFKKADGTYFNVNIPDSTPFASGLMSASDKFKLDMLKGITVRLEHEDSQIVISNGLGEDYIEHASPTRCGVLSKEDYVKFNGGIVSASDKERIAKAALLQKLVKGGSMDIVDLYVDADGNPVIDVATYQSGAGTFKTTHYAMYVGGKYYVYDKLRNIDRSYSYSHIGTYTEEDAPQDLLDAFKDRTASAIEWAKKAKNGGFDYDCYNEEGVYRIWLVDGNSTRINEPFDFTNATPNAPGMMSKEDKQAVESFKSIFGADVEARSEEGLSISVDRGTIVSFGSLHIKSDEHLMIRCGWTCDVEIIFGDGDDTEEISVRTGQQFHIPNPFSKSFYTDIKIHECKTLSYHQFTATLFVVKD